MRKDYMRKTVLLKAGTTVKVTVSQARTPSIRQNSNYYFAHSLRGVVVVRIIDKIVSKCEGECITFETLLNPKKILFSKSLSFGKLGAIFRQIEDQSG